MVVGLLADPAAVRDQVVVAHDQGVDARTAVHQGRRASNLDHVAAAQAEQCVAGVAPQEVGVVVSDEHVAEQGPRAQGLDAAEVFHIAVAIVVDGLGGEARHHALGG